MKNLKLVAMLTQLPRPELNEFIRYVDSDFFNRKAVVKTFLGHLVDHIKGKTELPDRNTLFAELFPRSAAQYAELDPDKRKQTIRRRMDNLTYELRSLLDDFLVWKMDQKMTLEKGFRILEAYDHYIFREAFNNQFRKLDRLLDRSYRNDAYYHWYKYRLKQIGHEFNSASRPAENFVEVSDALVHLDTFYAQLKLIESWIALLRDTMLNHTPWLEGVENALTLAENSPFRDDFIVRAYRIVVRDFIDSSFSKAHILELFAEFKEQFSLLEPQTAFGIFNMISNYIILLQEFHGKKMPQEQFQIMSYGLEQGLLFRGTAISFASFYNAVGTGLRAHQLEWAEGFIRDYSSHLLPEIRESTVSLTTARLRFVQKDYAAVLKILRFKHKVVSPFQKLISKALRLQCFYEMGNFDLLENELEAGRKFAERTQEVGQQYADKFGQFVQIVRQLHFARSRGQAAPAARESLSASNSILFQPWLWEKAKELETS